MKRKVKRQGQKKWVAFLAPLSVITTLVIVLYYSFKDTITPWLTDLIQVIFSIDEKSSLALLILFFIALAVIIFLSFLVSRLYLNYHKPNKKYFDLIDFEKPSAEVIKKAVEGIIYSEKTKPFFVHVAPINDEIEEINKVLDSKSFVWENGKPGEGKSMLAYHVLYRYRKKIEITYRCIPITIFRLKYKNYKLNLNRVKDEKEIDAILAELDSLKGGKRKIILIDDAHKLNFEDKLRFEFEEEAQEHINGKFIWINTIYLENKKSEITDSISIEFEKLYPKLLSGLYESQNPIIKDFIKNKCTGLQNAIELKGKGKIRDPWHFNFVASNGEQRVFKLLEKLSGKKEEQDVLLLSIFLFSVRNIITGEKEINQTEFTNLLTSIDDTYLKKNVESYKPSNIIDDLASQDKGRFLIIENKSSLDRGFLQAPHFKLSIAIIKSITTLFTDENLIKEIIDASKLLLLDDYKANKYFNIYFTSLGKYQKYFLDENQSWIKSYLSNLILEQLHVYTFLLTTLKNNHIAFYKEFVTDEYIHTIAPTISLIGTNRFSSFQGFAGALGKERDKLIAKLNWETLAETANNADVNQLSTLEALLNALGTAKENLITKLNWETLAKTANKAEVAQLKQVADFIKALDTARDKEKILSRLDWETLAKSANKVEPDQFKQVAAFINSLGTDKEKEKLIAKLNWETFAKAANNAEADQFSQLEAILSALGSHKGHLIAKLDLDKLAKTANNAEVAQFGQLEAILNALGTYKVQLIAKLDLETLAKTANNADVTHFNQIGDLINALGTVKEKEKLISKLDWETFANKANKAEVTHFSQVADLINTLCADKEKEKLISKLDWETFANKANKADVTHFSQVADLINALGTINEKARLLAKLDWETLTTTTNKANVAQFSQVAHFINALGNDKHKLLCKFTDSDWEAFVNKANKVEAAQLIGLSSFAMSLSDYKINLTNFIDNENIVNWSKTVGLGQINPLCLIIALLEEEKQDDVICKVDWLGLLSKLKIKHLLHVKCLLNILYFIERKQTILNQPIKQDTVLTYLEFNQDKIIFNLIQYFISPQDFQTLARLLTLLNPYEIEFSNKIVEKLKYKIINNFDITPRYYNSFANLLNSIYLINPGISNLIIINELVRDKLYSSFEDNLLIEQIEGFQNLLETIRIINPYKYQEINQMDRIVSLNLSDHI